ncbi:hypothetical protein K1X76_07465 [bacterium]|nr:hypothetical protein [bacterium]
MKFFTLAFLLFLSLPALARVDYTATASFEHQSFLKNRNVHSHNDTDTIAADIDLMYGNEKNIKIDLHPRIQVDVLDASRNRYDPQEAYFLYYTSHHQILAGEKIREWGVANSFNPSQVLNRKDYETDFYNPPLMGEVQVAYQYSLETQGVLKNISFEGMFFPLFLTTPLPNRDTRFGLRGQANGIDYSLFENQDSPNGANTLAGALAIKSNFSFGDASLLYYHGPHHDPAYLLMLDGTGGLRVRPFYYTADIIAFNAEVPYKGFRFYFESAYTHTDNDSDKAHAINFEGGNALPGNYFQFVPGADYTFYGVLGKSNVTLAAEYLGEDSHESNLKNFRPFKNDVFLGVTWDFQNKLMSALKLGVIKDLSNAETAILFDAETKIYKDLKASLTALILTQGDITYSPISYFDNNSRVGAQLSYTFGGEVKKKSPH